MHKALVATLSLAALTLSAIVNAAQGSNVSPEGDASQEYLSRKIFGADTICQYYARRAVEQQAANVKLECSFSGPEWSANVDYHRNWCVDGNNYKNAWPGDNYRAQSLRQCIAAKKEEQSSKKVEKYRAPVDSDCYVSGVIDSGSKSLGYGMFVYLRREYLLQRERKRVKYHWGLGMEGEGKYIELCAGPYLIKGLGCRERYCSGVRAKCCRFTRDYSLGMIPDAASSDPRPPILQAEESFIMNRWSNWFSEEGPNNQQISYDSFMRDIACRGKYCDQMSLLFSRHPKIRNTGQCYWTPDFSEESSKLGYPAVTCGPSEFAAGARCLGSYCDNIQLHCCRAELADK